MHIKFLFFRCLVYFILFSLPFASLRGATILPGQLKLNPFTLKDQNGAEFKSDKLKGKPTVVNFIFTSCPHFCPTLSRKMKKVSEIEVLKKKANYLSITVDPETDSPAVLKAYASRFKAGSDWNFLTGDTKKVHQIIRKSFFAPSASGDAAGKSPVHSEKFVLIDKDGWIRGYYDVTDKVGYRTLVSELKKLAVNL